MPRTKGKKEPIRDKKLIRVMKEWLLLNKSYRDYFLFYLGINTGLRISDLLSLRVMDIRDRDEIRIVTKKTQREVVIPLNMSLQSEIKKFVEFKPDSEYLFLSREGDNRPITSQMADKVLKDAAAAVGVKNWGTHSMRKSFGYHYYVSTKDVYFLMRLFGHSSQHQTLDYIGVTYDEIRESLKDFTL